MSGSPFAGEDEAREIADVNVVPLADVSLVLLIILLVLSPMMAQRMMQVSTAARKAGAEPAPEPPAPEPLPEAPPELVLVVSVGPGGISVGGQSFRGPGDFTAFLREELGRRQDKKVFVSPHPEAPHGQVVHMLEMVKDCGASSVALVQTQEEPPAEEALAEEPR